MAPKTTDKNGLRGLRKPVPALAAAVGKGVLSHLAKELHAHDGKDEDDDAEDKGEVGEGAHRVHHDGQNVVQGLPGLGQLEHPAKKIIFLA